MEKFSEIGLRFLILLIISIDCNENIRKSNSRGQRVFFSAQEVSVLRLFDKKFLLINS